MKETVKRTKKKVTVADVVIFVAVYMGIGIGLKLFALCVLHGQPLDGNALADAVAAGFGLMVARQIVWAVEYFILGHTL